MTAGAETDDARRRLLRVLHENGRALDRLVASYVRSAADRADLLQDIALALWSALPRFRNECSERTFLYRVAHNRALTFVSKRGGPTEAIDDYADRVVATTPR